MKRQREKTEESPKEVKQNFVTSKYAMTILYFVLVSSVLVILVRQFMEERYEHCFTCLLTLLLFLVPTFVERRLKINVPNTLEVIILLFIYAAEILGEIRGYYLKVSWWDSMLHSLNGFLMAAIGLAMVDILNRNNVFKFRLSPIFVALVAFCFSMTIGVLWEFFEYTMDVFMQTDMQKDVVASTFSSVDLHPDGENTPILVTGIEDVLLKGSNLSVNGVPVKEYALNLGGYLDLGIHDTMKDLLVNFIGAVVFSVIGFFYIKNRGKGGWIKRLIPHLKKEEK